MRYSDDCCSGEPYEEGGSEFRVWQNVTAPALDGNSGDAGGIRLT